ncbi:MAG: Carbamoyltransferase family protein [Candidatus Jettenia ecosi]|uniref:Carbamoyltransferase family protein n=1 Tax=Candidatus Jettenia ecosi TaxID=2494326 RepID=A0A533QBJ8_9BACT|nr:MAG: Carbamoyltransferase family protein [Candidatus Jettenia ecosi]
MYTLGINAAYHDSAACLVKNGKVIAASEEERFTGIKHGKRPIPFSTYELPFHAIDYCLKEARLILSEVDHIAYSYNPFLLLKEDGRDTVITLPLEPSAHKVSESWESPWDPLFISSIINAPRQLVDGVPYHLKERFRKARIDGPYTWHFIDHHTAHAASAFFASPFRSAAVLTLDGRGEKTTTSYSLGADCRLERLGEVTMPHSLGLFYEQMTTYLGFQHSSDEYKVMALASYGKPVYADEFRNIIQVKDHGQYTIAQPSLEKLLGPARKRGGPLHQYHYDIANSLQTVLEETVLHIVHWLQKKTGEDNLCMAGGVALNCVMNAYLRDRGPFKHVWVQPAAGDAGTALGAALWTDALMRKKFQGKRDYSMEHTYLGPCYSDYEIKEFLSWSKLHHRKLSNIAEEATALLIQDKVIGWFQGRMEFGPRALGARSIIASPMKACMQARLNEIKDREDFRPVAPVVLEEEASNWFINAGISPFMTFVHSVRPEKADLIPAVCHIDGSARIQTIKREYNPAYYDLIHAFKMHTGVPILINTSFNTRGKPIVCTPRDAVECFWTSPLDALVIGSYLLEKPKERK